MILSDSIQAAVTEIRANSFRSVLTTLGIVIAVTAVVGVVSILEGMSTYITGFIQGMGSDAMWIYPYHPPESQARGIGRVEMTREDSEAVLQHCSAVTQVCPIVQANVTVGHGGEEATISLFGATPEFQEIRDWYVEWGRYFSDLDLAGHKMVCVVGTDLLHKLGTDFSILGKRIRIQNHLFRVVGILEEKGSFFGQSQDEVVIIPFTTAVKILGSNYGRQVTVLAQLQSADDASEAIEQVRTLLRSRHRLRPEHPDDFKISTQDQILDFFRKASQATTVVLAGIVGISLLVGGIGIMNIMLVSVTERTREIGILKALGARPKDILIQFLVEAVILSLFGGLIGLVFGFLLGIGAAAVSPLPPSPPPLWAVLLSVAFSGLTGVFFGLYPAIQAAKLNPIDSLRYE